MSYLMEGCWGEGNRDVIAVHTATDPTPQAVCCDGLEEIHRFSWAPAGDMIAIIAEPVDAEYADVYVATWDGQQFGPVQLVSEPLADDATGARYAEFPPPDSTRLAYYADTDGDAYVELHVVDLYADGSKKSHQMLWSEVYYDNFAIAAGRPDIIVWSPSGHLAAVILVNDIVFVDYTIGVAFSDDAATTAEVEHTTLPADYDDLTLDWSPAEDLLAVSVKSSGSDPLLLVRAHATSLNGAEEIATGIGNHDFRWSPAGDYLAFAEEGLHVLAPDGTEVTNFFTDRYALSFLWAPAPL